MKRLTLILDAIVGILSAAPAQESRHYVFCGLDRERITEPAVVETPALVGALLKYRWSELELRRNEYNFSAIRHDVSFLVREWKR